MFLAVITDRKIARLFDLSDEGVLTEFATFNNIDALAHERDLTSDRPGRARNVGARRPQTLAPRQSASARSLQRWLRFVAGQVDAVIARLDCEGLLLIAAPRVVAPLREALPGRSRRAVCAELNRDLSKLPLAELGGRLLELRNAVLRDRRRAALMRGRIARPAATLGPARL